MISVENISKSFNGHLALDNVSLQVGEGALFGLIGPDGAGKSTLFRILATLLLADSGQASIEGYDVVKDFKNIRGRIGYMPGQFSLYQDLSVNENLNFFATVFGADVQSNYEVIKDIFDQLKPFGHRRAADLSGGMKQKLALSCALIHKPKVLLLDEPTTGVDPVSRAEFWDTLQALRQQGFTFLVSTPFMDEAARCETIALIDRGKILAIDSPKNIRSRFPKTLFAIRTDSDMYTLLGDLRAYPHMRSTNAFGQYVHYTDQTDGHEVLDNLHHYLEEKNHHNIKVDEIDPDIEDSFIDFMEQKRSP